jgi:hypothetical protein
MAVAQRSKQDSGEQATCRVLAPVPGHQVSRRCCRADYVGVTAGLGVPTTLTWNGSNSTAPETPTGTCDSRDHECRDKCHEVDPGPTQHRL